MSSLPKDEELQKIDGELADAGLPLRYRPLECFKRVYGVVKDDKRDELFDPVVQWYLATYGDEARWDGVIGRCPLLIRGKVYLGVARFTTAAQAVMNVRDEIEELPDAVANSLSKDEGRIITEQLIMANLGIRTLYNLTVDDHCLTESERGLVWRGLHDLENAAIILKHAGDTQTATVQAHEAGEKFLKAALQGSGYTKNLKNLHHDVPKIFRELVRAESRYSWLEEPVENLQKLAPSMQLRYGYTPRSLANAVSAFHAALYICGVLANMWLFDMARGTTSSSFQKGRFYINGAGLTYYCRRVRGDTTILRLFHSNNLTGMQMADISVKTMHSALYLEIADATEMNRLKRRLIFQMRNRGKRVSPETIGLRMTNGPEGSYVTASIKTLMAVRNNNAT